MDLDRLGRLLTDQLEEEKDVPSFLTYPSCLLELLAAHSKEGRKVFACYALPEASGMASRGMEPCTC